MTASILPRPLRRPPAAAVVAAALRDLAGGRLAGLPVTLRFWDGSELPATTGDNGRPAPTVTVRRPRAIAHLLAEPGELGLSRAWVDGSLSTDDDLEQLLGLRSRLQEVSLTRADRRRVLLAAVRMAGPRVLRHPPIPAAEINVAGERHSLQRDRASVRHHYDVSNDFYRLLLGPTLVYSCAYFADPDEDLEAAQERKLELICRKLMLQPGEELLDIGCGWGSLVIHAAVHHGVHATGVTLSEPQAELARERAAEAGVADRVHVRVADYRELGTARFDKIASVGMYEHVGRAELGRYARTAHGLLRPGGLMLNHGITRVGRDRPDPKSFVARYVFPDGDLHPIANLLAEMQEAGFEIRDVEALRDHYPLTLRRWSANLHARRAEAEALIGTQRARVWELYMAGAARAFDDVEIGVYQTLGARIGGPHRLPLRRSQWLAQPPATPSQASAAAT